MTEIGRGNDLKDPRQGDEDALSPKTTPLSSLKSFIKDQVTCHHQLDWESSVFLYSSENNLSKIIFGKEFELSVI